MTWDSFWDRVTDDQRVLKEDALEYVRNLAVVVPLTPGTSVLLVFLSDEFAVHLPDDALMSDDFSTIDGIAAIVCRVGDGKRGC